MKASLALCLTLALTAFAGDMGDKYQKYINMLCGDMAMNNEKSVQKLLECVDEQLKSKILDTINTCNDVTSLDAAIKKGCANKMMTDTPSKCLLDKLNWVDADFPKVNATFYDCFAKVWMGN